MKLPGVFQDIYFGKIDNSTAFIGSIYTCLSNKFKIYKAEIKLTRIWGKK